MSALQEVVQQLENILKTSNEYGPFVCIDTPAPINILQVDTNSNGIQKNTETSSDLLQHESNTLISQGLNQQDDHGVIIGQSFGKDLVGSRHRDTGSNLLGENGICHDNIGTIHVEESHEVRVTDHMTIPTCNPVNSNSQDVNGASNESLQEESVGEVQECGKVTVNNSVPLTHAVNNQVFSNNPLIQTCSENAVPITKYGLLLDGDNGNEKKDEGEVIVKPLKRKRGRPRKIIDPNSIVPKIKRPRGRPRKYPAPNSDLDHILPIEIEHISSKAKHAVPAIVSDELDDHNGVGLSVHLEGEKEGPRTTYDFFSVLGLQNCGRKCIPAVLNQGAPGVQEQQEQILSEGSIVSLTEEVNYNHVGSIDVPEESFRFHGDAEFICSVSNNEEARTRPAFPEEQCCLRPTEGFATDVTMQNSNTSTAHVEKHEENEEGEKTNGNKIDQPIKRKRGRPKRPVQNINLKRRLEKVPVTNTSHVGVASASMDVVGLSPLSCTTIIQNFHEHSHGPKGVCTQTTNGDREGDLGYNHGFPVERTCCKVNNDILENEKIEENKEKCRQEQSGSLSVWEKDTATVQDGTNEGFMEDTVPKLRLRRKMGSETRENQIKSLISIFKATDGDDNSIERDAAAGIYYSDSTEKVSHTKVPAVHQDEECPLVMESEVAMDSHPLSDQALSKEILPTNDKAIYEEILPTAVSTDVFPLEDLRDQLNLLPDHPQKTYDISGKSIKGQTSTKDESDEIVISKDSCETPKKRGRGRPKKIRPINGEAAKDDHDQLHKERVRSNPRKIRPLEKVVHDVQKSDDASLDSHLPLYPDDKFHEDENKKFDMVSNTTILNDSETEVMNNEREASKLSKKKLGTDQRVISIVCSSESEEERQKKTAEILPDDDQALTEEILSTSDLALTEDILRTNDQSLNKEMLPSSDQVMAEEILSTNDQLLIREILPPTDVLSLGDVNGKWNLLPDHPENLQKVCNASEMAIQDQTSVTDESNKMVISKVTCETAMKRGRGRPKKIRPIDKEVTKDDSSLPTEKRGRGRPRKIRSSEEVVQGIEITNVTSLDSHLSSLPDKEYQEDIHKDHDMGSTVTTILNDSKLYEHVSLNALNEMTHCKLLGRNSEAGLNQETKVTKNDRKTESRVTNKPEVVQRDITNVCSSETEEAILKKTADILPPKDHSLNEEMLPINDQQLTGKILPPTYLLPLGDLRGKLNLLPDQPEYLQKVCNASGIGIKEQTSAKDESDKLVISKDSCETPTKRGRGRPRKIRVVDKEVTKDNSGQFTKEKRSEEVLHIDKTNASLLDSHLLLVPENKVHVYSDKNLDLGSSAILSLNDSNQKAQVMRNERKMASRISNRPEMVQRDTSIICSSESEEETLKKTAENLPPNDQILTDEIFSTPNNDQEMTKEIFSTNDQLLPKEILPPTDPSDVLSLGDVRGKLNLLPDHPEKLQKVCNASEMAIQDQTSVTDESDEMVISRDTCETPMKRGRGRPRKIRPIDKEETKDDSSLPTEKRGRGRPRKIRSSEEVVQGIEITNVTSLDSHLSSLPDKEYQEDIHKDHDMGSTVTILNDSKLYEHVSLNALNEMTHCKLLGRNSEAGLNQETKVTRSDRKTDSRITNKPQVVQRDITNVCSSETEEAILKKTADILPPKDHSLSEETLPINDQQMTEVILPPTHVLPLGDVNGKLNLLPDYPENLQNVCNASEMDIQDQSSVTDESDEMVISRDTCETPMKRGRGRPRKIRPIDKDVTKDDSSLPTEKRGRGRPRKIRSSEEVVQGIEITNVASLDSHLSSLPDKEYQEDIHKDHDMGSTVTTLLNDSKLYEHVSLNVLNEMTHCKLSGRDSEAGLNQETEVMRSERKMDSRITNKPQVVQRDITNVCSSESEEEEILTKTADILPPKDQSLNEDMLPSNDQQMTEEILPMAVPTDVLPLGDLGGQLNLLHDHPEKPHKDTNRIGFREQTSAKDECVDSCKTPTKRGRGRPRKMRLIDKEVTKDDSGLPAEKRGRSRTGKIRPSGEVIISNEKTNNAFSDSHLSLYHEDKNLDVGSNATASLSNSSIIDYVSPSTLNEMAYCNLLGSSNQETEKVKNEMDSASRISTKPETVQRVISIVCSSETEVHYSKIIKQRRKQHAFKPHPHRFSTDVPTTDSRALPSFQSKRRSILLQRRCMKKTSVRIKKLPKRLINGSLNLDDQSRLAQLFQCPDKHSQGRTKKCRDVKSQSMSGLPHQMLPAKSTPLSSGGRVIAPHAHGYVQSSISSSPQKTIRLTYGDKNAQSSQVNDEIRKCSHSHKKILKHPPLPFNSMGASVSAKSLIMDRIKKDAAMLQGDFQNKEIQKNFKVGQITARARTNISYEKTGRGRPSKKFVSFGTSVKQRIDDYQPRGPLLISKRLFSFKRKSARDITLNNLKKKERVHVASHKNIPNSVTCGKIRRKVGRPRKNPPTLDIHDSTKNCRSVSEVKRKRGRPRKNPILADTVDPEKTSEGAQPCNELKKQIENCSSSQDIQLMTKKEGRQRKKPERLEYKHQEEKPYKSPSSVVSPIKGSEPDSAIQPLAKKRDWPRKYQCEEITPKYPSVPLPITDNYLFGRFGFQPSNIPGCNETPSCDFPLPIEEATVEEIPGALTESARESIQADIVTDLGDSVPQPAFFDSEADKDVITEGHWTPDMQQNYPEPPDLSCCIEVFTEAVLPPPPSLNMELDTTSLLNT
ncbi:uncharacterized protein LOC121425148 [Lytechinus variegatus]|uniref:uncharacterized protein LOC121425148 n=1 Tax=Lytechinus variegatus TaxID=7654 RepID=UPI001BB1E3B2|nr:uncharacterized protein LOC121425148 [Lytechinus variegatus]